MGDMADFALDCASDEYEHFTKYQYASTAVQYEEGICDEYGVIIGHPGISGVTRKVHGAGPCPKCGGETIKKEGKFGTFYGCNKFPKCNGSRGI